MAFSRDVYARRPPSMREQRDGVKGAEFSAEVIETIRNLSMPGWSSYASLYRRQPAVRSIVDFLARNIAQLNPKCYERLGDTDRIEVGQHPLAELLRHPNPVTTRFRHLRDTVADLAIYDVAYWEKVGRGRQLRVFRRPVPTMLVDEIDGRNRFRYVYAGVDREIPASRLVIFPGYTPDGVGLGVAPLETLRQILWADWSSMNHRAGFWNNAARVSGVIERPADAPKWSDEARRRFRADLEQMHTGRENSGRTAILEEGMKWNGTAFSPKDSEYIEGRRLTYEEVSVAYFGPVVGRAFMEATGAGTESQHRQLYQDVLGPWLGYLEDEIELQLLPEYEMSAGSRAGQRIYVEFDLAAKLKGSFEEQSKSIASSTGVPYVSVNEGRARLNLPKIDAKWADEPVRPLNVMYGGQPAVTVPTQVPGDVPMLASVDDERRMVFAERFADVFRKFFARQQSSIKAGGPVDWGRWNRELTVDLALAGAALGYALPLAAAVNDDTRLALAAEADTGHVFDVSRSRVDALAAECATATLEQEAAA